MRAHHDARHAAGHGHSHPTPPAGGGLVQLSPSLYWYRDTCNVYLLVRGRPRPPHRLRLGRHPRAPRRGGRPPDRVGAPHPPPPRPVPGGPSPGRARRPDRGARARGRAVRRDRRVLAAEAHLRQLRRLQHRVHAAAAGPGGPHAPRLRDVRLARPRHPRPADAGAHQGLGHLRGRDRRRADGVQRRPHRRARPRPHDPRPPVAVRPARRGRGRAPLRDAPRRAAAPAALSLARPPDGRRAGGALRLLEPKLRLLYGLQGEMRKNRVWPVWPHSVDQPKTHVLPHVWANPHSLANCYALMADDGRALLLDYGFPSWDHMAADLRFVEHSLDDLKAVAGLRAVDVVIPSHYHDDHLAGLPWLQQTQGTKAWIFENFAEIVSNPAGYNVPCLLPHPIRVDRALPDGGRVSWDRWTFDVFHMPGPHLVGARPLRRDRRHARRVHRRQPPPGHGEPAPRRGARLPEQDARGLDRGRRPAAHGVRAGAAPHRPHRGAPRRPEDARGLPRLGAPARGRLPDAGRGAGRGELRARPELRDALSRTGTAPARATGCRSSSGSPTTARRDAIARASLVAPPGWSVAPGEATPAIARRRERARSGSWSRCAPGATGRQVLCAELSLGERRFGQIAEALVDVA